MEHRRQDIYESDQARGDGKGYGGRPSQREGTWFDMLRQSRRSTIIFRLVILAFIILMSLFIIEQTQTMREKDWAAYDDTGDVRFTAVRTASVMDMGADIESELIMDEMLDMETTPISEGSTIEVNTHWVKQVAMHLLKAERAYTLDEWGKAVQHYKSVLKIMPDIKGVDAKLGLCYMNMKDYNSSADAFSKVSSSETNAFRVLNNLGVARLASKDFNAAEKNFARVLELEPNYAPALHNMALLYYRTKMYEESADYFEGYLALNETDIDAMQLYTDTLIKLERWKKASDILRASSKQMPQAAPLFMSLAYVLSKQGKNDEAMDSLNRGVRLMDSNKAMAMIAAPEYDALRQRSDFKELVDQLTSKEL